MSKSFIVLALFFISQVLAEITCNRGGGKRQKYAAGSCYMVHCSGMGKDTIVGGGPANQWLVQGNQLSLGCSDMKLDLSKDLAVLKIPELAGERDCAACRCEQDLCNEGTDPEEVKNKIKNMHSNEPEPKPEPIPEPKPEPKPNPGISCADGGGKRKTYAVGSSCFFIHCSGMADNEGIFGGGPADQWLVQGNQLSLGCSDMKLDLSKDLAVLKIPELAGEKDCAACRCEQNLCNDGSNPEEVKNKIKNEKSNNGGNGPNPSPGKNNEAQKNGNGLNYDIITFSAMMKLFN